VASNTGLRNQELASLTPESFELEGDEPNVIVQASYSKHRREDVQPIRADLAELLREYIRDKPAGERLWASRWWTKAAKMIRADLKDARKQWIEEAGENAEERKAREKSDFLTYVNADGEVFDFYAQRGQMITALEQSGASLKTLQALARHSRVETTLKHYARKPRLADSRAALDALPALPTNRPEAPAEVLKATGTDGNIISGCARVAQTGESVSDSVRLVETTDTETPATSVGASGCGRGDLNPTETRRDRKRVRGPSRIRTGDGGFAIRCKTEKTLVFLVFSQKRPQ
jgi:Phage integrase family